MAEFKFPTEEVELPSKGLIYPKSNPLSSGKIELKYMTAKEEDILTNQNYIEKGIVLDKLLESLTMKKVDLKDLCIGDKNAIMVAARILGYGQDYEFTYNEENYKVDLSQLKNKEFDSSLVTEQGTGKFTLPKSTSEIEFKFLTDKENDKIDEEITSLSKISKNTSAEVTTRLKHTIVSVDGTTERNEIVNFVENYLLAQDARALRNYIKDISPDINMSFITNHGEEVMIPININFFWPDA
jgi:hypothetical protein